MPDMARRTWTRFSAHWPRNRLGGVNGEEQHNLTPDNEVLRRMTSRSDAGRAEGGVERQARRWTVRVIALLLVLQAFSLVGISVIYLARVNWDLELGDVMLSVMALEALLLAAFLTPIGLFELITAWGVWFGRPPSWLNAMIAQGVLLIFCLSSYVTGRGESFIYLLMLMCIVLVLYLNANDVRLSFRGNSNKTRTPRARA